MKLREELTVLVQLDSKTLTGGLSYNIQDDGSLTFRDFAIDRDAYATISSSIASTPEFRQLEMRVSCLENHIKAMEKFQDSKYKIVYGEH